MVGEFVSSSMGSTLVSRNTAAPRPAVAASGGNGRPGQVGDLSPTCAMWLFAARWFGGSDDLLGMQLADLLGAIPQLRQHLVGMLAEQRRAGNLRGEARELDGATDSEVRAALLLLHLDHAAAGAQRRIVGDLPHGQHRRTWHFEFAQDFDRLELGLVGEPRLDLLEDVEDVRLACARRGVGRIVLPFRVADGLAAGPPILLLDREVNIRVRVGLPALALQDPARLAAAAGIAAARHRVAELAVRVLRIFFEIADVFEPLLVAQLDAAKIEHGVLHRDGHLLALAGLRTVDQRSQDADREMHAGVAVAERRGADRWWAIPKSRRGCGAAGALRDVLVDLQIRIGRFVD